MEIFTGHNDFSDPPAIGVLKWNKKFIHAKYGGHYKFSVILPCKKGNGLKLSEPIFIADNCRGVSNHSGGYSFAITSRNKTYIVYGVLRDCPSGSNPVYIAVIDRNTQQVISNKFLAWAGPKEPDQHTTPVITIDKKGYLHVVTGGHFGPFRYLRSLMPHDIETGWAEPVKMHYDQTYATLVCDQYNNLHSICRVVPNLVSQRKKGLNQNWSSPEEIVLAPKGYEGYSIFYHRLFIDKRHEMYLSFSFSDSSSKVVFPRSLIVSEDQGNTWKLATTQIFNSRIK